MPPNSDKELASKAKSEFLKSNYTNCLELLEKLSVKNDDLKLLHNKAVVEFYKSGTKQTGAFQDALKAVFQKAKLRPERLSTLEDVDNCGLYYNYAVVLYHQRQYRRALSILSKIFKYIEPLDDSTAKRIGLLLVECCLCSHQPNMALDVIKVVESKFLSKPEDIKRKDGTPTGLYSRIQRCRCRALLQLHNTEELKPLLAQLPNTSVYLAFLESYSEYLSGRGREAVACLGRIASMRRPSFADTGEHMATMYYNNLACIHHCCLNRPTVACHYLQTALAENQTATASAKTEGGSAGGSLHTIGGSRHYELLYNAGITLLHAGRPRRAFDCLTEAIQVYHTNPRLWLRLAECCIMVYRQDRYGERGSEFDSPSLVEGKLGAGQHRKLIIHGSSVASSSDQISAAIPNPTMEFASLALRNAWLILGEDGEGECPVTVEPANPVTPDQVQTIRCSVLVAAVFVHLCLQEPLLALEQAVKLLQQRLLAPAQKLLARLYAAEALLLLDRSDEALCHLSCPASPQQPTSPPAATHQTPTEEPDESPLLLHNADVVCSPVKLSWRPSTQLGARMCLQYNMAVARARRGELEKAWELLKTMNPASAEVPPQVIQLALYIQLKLGNLDMVRSIIKQHVPRGK